MPPAHAQQHLAYLDLLSERLYLPVVTHPHGELEQRCLGVLHWQQCLLDGRLPERDTVDWPRQPARDLLLEQLHGSGLPAHCREQPQRTEQLLLDMLAWLDHQPVDFTSATDQREPHHPDPDDSRPLPHDAGQNEVTDPGSRQPPDTDAALSWQQQAAGLDALDMLSRDYVIQRQLGQDFSSGLLARVEWRALLQMHKSIKHSAYLKNIIALIGRGQQRAAEDQQGVEQSLTDSRAPTRQYQAQMTERAPLEATGITRSDDLGRMLAVELAALGHAKLKMLWHAKRAERLLLSYQYQGVLSEHLPVYDQQPRQPQAAGQQQISCQGPMIICLDTSASMKGRPETIAKAIVLETMRVAMRERRACMLFAFSGPAEIHRYELAHSETGWNNMLDMVRLSFHGGTDLTAVINHALALLEQKKWQQADALLISDSRFAVDNELQRRLHRAGRTLGLRMQGINVSDWNSRAMESICTPVYRISRL